MPKFLYYDKRARSLPAVGVSSFLWLKLGWERFSAWQEADDNTAASVAPEQCERRTSQDSLQGGPAARNRRHRSVSGSPNLPL